MSEPVGLSYGKGQLPVRLPASARATVIRKTPLPKIADPREAIRHALDFPTAAAPLQTLARGKRSACIVICDITRPVPNHLFLRPMIEHLLAAGIPAKGITVLVATGLHRPNEGAELAELIGDSWVLENVSVLNHFARNDADHIDLGFTSTRRTPVKLDRSLVQADLKIVTGLVEPHFMAGYSGGRKVIAPGVAHADTIRTFHNSRFMEDPLARACNLDGNPLHEEQLEIVRMLGDVYALNTVIDEDRHLVHVTFGEVIASHLAAVNFVRDSTEIKVPRKFKTVVTSCAGYPLDKTYYQTVKGMVTPPRHPRTRRHAHHRLRMLRGPRLARIPRVPGTPSSASAPTPSSRPCSKNRSPTSTNGNPKCSSSPSASAASSSTPPAFSATTAASPASTWSTTSTTPSPKASPRANDPDLALIPEGPYVVPFCSA